MCSQENKKILSHDAENNTAFALARINNNNATRTIAIQ